MKYKLNKKLQDRLDMELQEEAIKALSGGQMRPEEINAKGIVMEFSPPLKPKFVRDLTSEKVYWV